MKVLLQKVSRASVTVSEKEVGSIGQGLLLLTGIGKTDSEETVEAMAEKVSNIRVFPDDKGRFHYSVLDVKGEVLVVPQFTLYASTAKGRRPEFFDAREPKEANALCKKFVEALKNQGISKVSEGEFGAMMQVALVNEGPVTIMLEL
jgi:D-tyrosyl-tRNA(Tyr) deacylase